MVWFFAMSCLVSKNNVGYKGVTSQPRRRKRPERASLLILQQPSCEVARDFMISTRKSIRTI